MKVQTISHLKRFIKSTSVPFSVVFEVTNMCNLRCLHCYNQEDGTQLGLTEIKTILTDLDKSGCMKLTLTGGEPTLREDFAEILSYCHQREFATTLFTNAILISTDIKKAMLDKPLLAVETSLYGASSRIHDSITGVKGSFDITMENIRWMIEKKLRVIVKSVVMSLNIHDMNALYDLTNELGVGFQCSYRIFPSLNPKKNPENMRIKTEDIKSILKRNRNTLPRDTEDPDADLNDFICNAGRNSCCISAEGKVYPCVALRWECGDLREKSFSEIWEESPVFNRIRLYKEEDFEDCHRCKWKQHCDFCPGMGYFEHGNMLFPSKELCRITNALHL